MAVPNSTDNMNIIVSHSYSKENKGDAALLSVLLSDIKRGFENPHITVLTLEKTIPGETFEGVSIRPSFMYYARDYFEHKYLKILYAPLITVSTIVWACVYRITKWSIPLPRHIREVTDLYAHTDLIIPVGGGYILSGKGFVNTVRLFFVLHPFIVSLIIGKPTVLYTQSIGPFDNPLQEYFAKSVLRRLNGIIVRENISMSLMKKWGITKKVTQSVDSGFLFDSSIKKEIRNDLHVSNNQMLIGITVRSLFHDQRQLRYEKAVAGFADYAIEKYGAKIVFIPQVTNDLHLDDDRDSSQRVHDYMKQKDGATVVTERYDHQTIKALYSSLNFIVGTRFHSVIFALSSYVPAIAIGYGYKTQGIMNDLELDDWVLDILTVETNQLIELFDRLVPNEQEYINHLKAVLPPYKEKAKESIYFVKKIFEQSMKHIPKKNSFSKGNIRVSILVVSLTIIIYFVLTAWIKIEPKSNTYQSSINTVATTTKPVSTSTAGLGIVSPPQDTQLLPPPGVVIPSPVSPKEIGHGIGIANGSSLSKLSPEELKSQLDLMVDLGIEWVRFDIEWGLVQYNSPDKSDWKRYDALVTEIVKHDLKAVGIIIFTPEWARTPGCTGGAKCPPRDPAQFAKFAAQVAERYKKDGLHYWEIWNEQNNFNFWATKSDCVAFAELLKKTYPAIKQVNPNAVVITGGLAPGSTNDVNFSPVDFTNCIYKNGAQPYFDAFGFHPYSYPQTPAQVTGGAWAQMYKTTTNLRNIMIANGDQDKKIWITEYGAPTNGPDPKWFVSEANQVKMVTEAMNMYKTFPWVGPFFWYTLKDSGTKPDTNENFFGLVRNDGTLKPAYTTLKNFIANGL